MKAHYEASGDLQRLVIWAACGLALAGLGLLVLELRRTERSGRWWVLTSGVLAATALLGAVLRPVTVRTQGTHVGAKVVVLVDTSRSMELTEGSRTRREVADEGLRALRQAQPEVRWTVLGFGEGTPEPMDFRRSDPVQKPVVGSGESAQVEPPASKAEPNAGALQGSAQHSDLVAALQTVSQSVEERPSAIVVLSDGRLDRPAKEGLKDAIEGAMRGLRVPIHTLSVGRRVPKDLSLRAVRTAGAAVAHQPFSLHLDLGCTGGLDCGKVRVSARELREQEPPVELATRVADFSGEEAHVELPLTLHRAGSRIVEVALQSIDGDEVPANDRRFVSIEVARDRVRILHVAGRPTYDVRALRTWLKSDASVDLVAFFILRTPTDDVHARQDDLALIPFPVDELFSEHLSSFDAVVLQDFDAGPYGLSRYLGNLKRYVTDGGGLIMVGGADAFVPGHYAGTPLAEVLPVELDGSSAGVSLEGFVPRFTAAGLHAPVLRPLRDLTADALPEMPGANLVGNPRPGAMVLLEHPQLRTATGAPMPVLALGEEGSGRTMALAVDGSHRLLFSGFAQATAGRAHGAFWDAMLGWLMRDPRFEAVRLELPRPCVAGVPSGLLLQARTGMKGRAKLRLSPLGEDKVVEERDLALDGTQPALPVSLPPLAEGGWLATLQLWEGDQELPPVRRDFSCEKGGDEWADTRPDPERLEAIAEASGGVALAASEASSLSLPPAVSVTSQRTVSALLPPWLWALAAALFWGAHWLARRRLGLS